MADAAISFAVEKLGDALISKINFLKGVEDEVRWVKDELQSMQCFLKDAAKKQVHDERIRKWISDVREVAQDAEDVIEIFTLKLDTPRRKRDLIRKWAGFPAHVSHLNRVGKEIKSIRSRLDEIVKRRERYGIQNLGEVGIESSSRSRSEMVELRRRMAPRFQKDRDVVGFNEDVDLLLKKVILDEGREGLSLAAIVGMGGIGKSTLARKIYNQPAIADRFEKRAWVVVSSEFAAEDIMKQIIHELSLPLNLEELKTLESIQGNLRRQEMLQQMLRNRLEGKRYFIVLDDVWENTHWEVLKNAFPDEQGKASCLLFTSRKEIFRKRHAYIHKMRVLNPNESWELLLKTAFIGRSEEIRCPEELEDIGRKILGKCGGLPLAITVAGGLLVNQEESKTGWENVLKQIKNYDSETSEIGKSVSAILESSYHNLPSHIKPCFLCLAFFKEDAVFRAKKLMYIWIALGFVQVQDGEEETVEGRASCYLDELINRNLVQVKDMTIDDRVKDCHVHDLLRELSIKKAKEEIGFESLTSEHSSSSSKPRHLVVQAIGEKLIQIDTWNRNKHLRSLFLHVEGLEFGDFCTITTPSYWKGFELLRILDIECSTFLSLPSTIRASIGIRYLRLKEKGELMLPSWLDALKNLEVLDIADCASVIFPDVTWKMDRLRHFYMQERSFMGGWRAFSDSMKKSSWHNLETLKYMWVEEVLFLIQGSGGRLRILGIQVLRRLGWAEMGRLLVESSTVQVLHIRCGESISGVDGNFPILNSLDQLTKLKVDAASFMRPFADKFPQNITHLTLYRCQIATNDLMQDLGKLPNLLVLKLNEVYIYYSRSVKVSHEGFPRLKVLHLRNMSWLENIEIEEGGMAELQRLEIHNCTMLQTENLRQQFRYAEIIHHH